jgi:hypothetical protein
MKSKYFGNKSIYILSSLIVLSFVIFYYNAKHVNLRIAKGGWGPHDYVAQKLHPENFKKNFPSGIFNYDHSLPMLFYYYLAEYFHVFPSVSMYPLMFLQTLLLVSAVYYLAYVMFENRFVSFLCSVGVLAGTLPGLNLARFGSGFGSLASFPLYYTFADAFWIFAIALSLRKHYIASFVMLAIAAYCHLVLGLFAFAFICSYILYKRQLLLEKNFGLGIFLFIVSVVPHLISSLNADGITSTEMPAESWLIQTRIFAYHWYPFILKMFGLRARYTFLPLVFLYFFCFAALRYQDLSDEKNKKIIIGCCACMLLSLMGVLFSELGIPFLIRISLQRSTIMVSLFGTLYVINYLYRKVISRHFIIGMVAIFFYILILSAQPGIAFLPIFILVLNDFRDNRLGPLHIRENSKVKTVFFIISGIIFFYSFLSITEMAIENKVLSWLLVHTWTPLRFFNPFAGGYFDLMLRGGWFKKQTLTGCLPGYIFIIVVLFAFLLALWKKNKKEVISLITCLLLLAVVALDAKRKDDNWAGRFADKAKSYLDTQVWAKNNTKEDALFAPDPTFYYGWRDYSSRSSFGNVREWAYTCICYASSNEVYKEGRKRCREFGIRLDDITETEVKTKGWTLTHKFTKAARDTYYNMTYDRLESLSMKYGIDYFVVDKARCDEIENNSFSKLPVAYQNEYYAVYAAQPQG